MWSKSVWANLCCVACLLPTVGGAQRVVKLAAADHGWLMVPVSINGSGPYSFVLDTGSNKTLIRKELLTSLRIFSTRAVPVNMLNGVSYMYETLVNDVSVAGMTVHNLEVGGMDAHHLDRFGVHALGILGEDFLKYFDLLIDNRAKSLTLDNSDELAQSLAGDRLPLSFSGMHGGQATMDRPVLELQLAPGTEAEQFLIDSGATYAMRFPAHLLPLQGSRGRSTILQTLDGNTSCGVDLIMLIVGKNIFPESRITSCDGITRDKFDVDGVLPTNMFARLFISHSGAYAIANPRMRKDFR
jgi:hypothetical protein